MGKFIFFRRVIEERVVDGGRVPLDAAAKSQKKRSR